VYNFTNIPLPEDESQRWMEEARERGIKRIAVMAQKYPSIDGHVNALASAVERGGASQIVYTYRFDAATTDFRAEIAAAQREKPDVFMVEGFNPALDTLGAQLRDAGIRDVAAIVALAISER